MIGRTLGKYKILEKLGAGGMGEVYRARDLHIGRQVAVKLLPSRLAGSQERLEGFQREAQALAALQHPNIVTIYSVEETDNTHLLTMEMVEGRKLSEIVPKGGLTVERFFELATPLVSAVAAAHERGIVHRDLKPDNVMVTEQGLLKVVDFGLARLGRSTRLGPAGSGSPQPQTAAGVPSDDRRVRGSLPYMSPEQLRGLPVDARSDVFSLGILLYKMVTGERPFRGDGGVSAAEVIVGGEPPPADSLRDGLPPRLVRLIHRCLEKDPAGRFPSAAELHGELEGIR